MVLIHIERAKQTLRIGDAVTITQIKSFTEDSLLLGLIGDCHNYFIVKSLSFETKKWAMIFQVADPSGSDVSHFNHTCAIAPSFPASQSDLPDGAMRKVWNLSGSPVAVVSSVDSPVESRNMKVPSWPVTYSSSALRKRTELPKNGRDKVSCFHVRLPSVVTNSEGTSSAVLS